MNVQCRYCAHLVPPENGSPFPWVCRFSLTVRDVPHECAKFAREPGADDDLGEVTDG